MTVYSAQRHVTALHTIADLITQHGLPVPIHITFDSARSTITSCTLRLDDNSRDAVSAWGEVLGVGEPQDSDVLGRESGESFVSVKADQWDMGSDPSLWLGFGHVCVWSVVDVEDGGEAQTAAVTDGGPVEEAPPARPSAPVVGHDRVTGVPLCEHGDDAEACQLAHRTPAQEAANAGQAEQAATPTMADLYPGGSGYHDAHEAYVAAVAAALEAAGFPVEDWHADPNDPRDGWIGFDMDRQGGIDGQPIWPYDEVGVGWCEDRGWHLLTIDDPHGRNSRFVHELGIARVASPVTVALAVAEKAGLTLELDDDSHPDLDFPDHTFEDDDVPFELALRHYATEDGGCE